MCNCAIFVTFSTLDVLSIKKVLNGFMRSNVYYHFFHVIILHFFVDSLKYRIYRIFFSHNRLSYEFQKLKIPLKPKEFEKG